MADQNFPPLLDLPPAPPPSREPGRPSIRDLLDQDKRAVEDALTNPKKGMDPKRLDDLRDFYQRFTPPVPGVFLSQPIQVAALPEALAQILSVAPVAQAVQAARAVNAPRQSFEESLESVPVEQARELSNAYLGQQNLAAAIGQMQANIDAMRADQLAAERAAQEERDQIAAMESLASAFGIGMEGPTPDMGRAGMVAAWGNPADDFADSVYGEDESTPGAMSTPFGVAMGTLGQNVDPNPMAGQFGPMAQHQTAAYAEEDPFGDDPFNSAQPAFSIAPALETVAQEIAFMSPYNAARFNDAWAHEARMEETRQAIAQSVAAREEAARVRAEMEAIISEMEQESDPLSDPLSSAYGDLSDALLGAQMQAAALSPVAMGAVFGADPFGSAMSVDDPAVASAFSGMASESDDESSPVGMAAQSMAAANAAFGTSPFSDALGLDSIGFSDPMSTDQASAQGISDPADSDDSGSEDSTPAASLGAMETGLTSADLGDPAAADPAAGTDAGAPGDSGAAGAAGGVGDGAGSDTSSSAGGSLGGVSSGANDPSNWARGGRVKGKSLAPHAKFRSKSRGLAAMRC